MKSALIYIIMCITFLQLNAQDAVVNAVQEINKIKRSSEYIFAESTTQDWSEALENAKTLLVSQIELWVKSELKDNESAGYVAKAGNHIFEIKATRGQLYRAFVYVKKSDLMPYSESDQVLVVPVNKEAEMTVSLVEQKENNEEEVIVAKPKYEPSEFEKTMLNVSSANSINSYIKELQSSNKIGAFGKYAEMPKDGDCYLFVYNPQGEIPAYLYRKDSKYINLKTGEEDEIKNYKGCGAFWFQLR